MKKVPLVIFFAILIAGCGLHEGVVQKGERSFIKFTGNRRVVTVHIDNAEPFNVRPSMRKAYQISPGKHTMKVYRDGSLIIDRVLVLENQATTEVIVP